MSRDWLKKWKKFVNYKLIKKGYANIAYKTEELLRDYPGPISNQTLLKDFNKYLRDDDVTDPTNLVIRRKTQEGI